MPKLLTPETFEFFATFLLAGYIVIIVRSRFVVGLRPKPSELVVEAIIFSLMVQFIVTMLSAISGWVGLTLWISQQGRLFEPGSDLYFFLRIVMLPAIFGALLGYSLTSGWKNAVLRRLSLPIVHPVQTGHDFAFGNNREASFVIVSYFDGTVIGGYFGENSLAASDEARGDIFLERLYTVSQNGDWAEPEVSRSALVNLKDVRTIEFLEMKG